MATFAILFALLLTPVPQTPSDTTPTPAPTATASPEPGHVELEDSVTVTATVSRTDTRLQDQPQRVEVIDREEIEEKALMTPGSVAMLLAETTGLRVQTTAPSLGAANVRIQGLRGRYSQLLADGLPLDGAQGDSLSLLQVPPLDLQQVEVIKGPATALYGASALGGVINLVSRRPAESERELLLNRTTLEGTDLTTWLTRPSGGWSATLIGGYHDQVRKDLDEDGWTDVAGYDRGHVRPRLFRSDERGGHVFLTAGAMVEDRVGGTLSGATAPDGAPFDESLDTVRLDAGALGRRVTTSGLVLTLRGSVSRTSHERRFGGPLERGTRWAPFGEAAVRGSRGVHTWVVGAALQQDRYDGRDIPGFDYAFTTGSVFAQDEIAFGPRLAAALSARVDRHSEYGTLVAPRASLLLRPGTGWTIRAAAAGGAFAPTPFLDETEESGLARLAPLTGLRAERAWGPSLDVTRTLGRLEVTATGFFSEVRHPVMLRDVAPARVELVNAARPTKTWGTEAIVRYRAGGLFLMATHGWTRSRETEPDADAPREVPLTPRHAGSMNAIWEGEEWGRIGLEVYYVGRQELDDDPYRVSGKPYVLLGVLGERRIGRVRLFANLENVLDVRQTKEAPLVRPTRRPDGRWTVEAWAPLDGRVINGGVRLSF